MFDDIHYKINVTKIKIREILMLLFIRLFIAHTTYMYIKYPTNI